MLIEGIVKAVRKDSKAIQVDGSWYSSFNPVDCHKNDLVKVEYVINGDFKNIKSLEILEAKSNVNQEKVNSSSPSPDAMTKADWEAKDRRYYRTQAMISASNFLQGREGMTLNDLQELAEFIENWVMR